ncbi:MAG: sulfite exporter TauE/SafE family protein [Anaerolineales bacterium]
MSHSITSNSVLAKRLPILLRWAAFSCLCLALLLPQGAARAHPVDMYAQQQFVALTSTDVSIDWKITPGPLLADSVWTAADGNHDGAISPQEARAWVAPFLAQLTITLDGQPLDDIRVEQLHWPAAIGVLRTGEDAIQVQLVAQWPAKLTGARRLQIHNAYLEANSLDWFSLSAGQGLSFETPQQKNGQLEMVIHAPAASTLTAWNSGQPDLTGILVNPQQNGGPATAVSALVGLVKTQDFSPLFLAGAFLLSLALGSLHALTPGHGKTLVAAYLVGSRGRSRDAVFLGLVVTLTHTGSVVLLGLLTLLASQFILPGLIAPWLEIVSGLLVIIFGLNLFFQRRQVLSDWWVARRAKQTAKIRLNPKTSFSLQNANVSPPAVGFGLRNTPHEHPHEHGPHTHTHDLPTGDVTWKSLLALGVSGGLVPCPDAIAILLVAVAVNRILFGMLLILAFSVGLALVLIAIGIAMVQGLRLVTRNDLLNRFSRYAPLVSALVVTGLGLGLTVNAVNALKFTSAASQPRGESGLLYLFPDSHGQQQLTRLPLTGGAATAYTGEPQGVAGYALSPDGQTIAYPVFHADGETFLKAMDADGSHARLVLDCKQAQCGGPVWYPDGRRLVYQRADYVDESGLPRFSLWWLDMMSGETRPVFQDGTFASYAPAFSPDGLWLSYKSPANNTLQIYNLQDGRVVSIPIPAQSGASESWSPGGDALLFWDAASPSAGASSLTGTALHVKRYDLASGRQTDLGGEPSQSDYAAVWSPDGAWVAIDRQLPAAAPSKRGDQVWLLRPDGSDARLLLGEADASYSDMRWSPDGKSLVYARYSYLKLGQSEIWRVDIQTGAKTRLVSGGILPVILP